jgi:hypothetical protein
MTLQDAPASHEFDVAVSFASEDRGLVEAVVTQLQRSGVRVFYDDDQTAAMWGEDLIEYFDQIYRLKSRYAVLFISHHYAAKMWTRHERRSALARGLQQSEPYVLPIRLDDTALDGLRPTVGYLDARRVGLDGIVDAVLAKLSGTLVITPREITGVPRDEVGRQLLLFERPPSWEHLYLVAQLLHERDLAEPMYRDHRLRYAAGTGTVVPRDNVYDFMSMALNDAQRLMRTLTQLMSPEAQDSAVGLPGQPGDPAAIAHLAARINSVYVDLMRWAARLRGASAPSEFHAALDALAAIVDEPIEAYRAFIERFAAQLEGLPQRLAAGEIGIELELTLTVDISQQSMAALDAEMMKLDPRWKPS